MGADCHMWLEVVGIDKHADGGDYVDGVAQIYVNRDYLLFGLLADVRMKDIVVFPPRGIPQAISYQAELEYCLYVCEQDGEGCCTAIQAQKWIKEGVSCWFDTNHTRITNPDWHSASFLYTDEVAKVAEEFEIKINEGINDKTYFRLVQMLKGLVQMMRCLDTPGYRSRITYWFDN